MAVSARAQKPLDPELVRLVKALAREDADADHRREQEACRRRAESGPSVMNPKIAAAPR